MSNTVVSYIQESFLTCRQLAERAGVTEEMVSRSPDLERRRVREAIEALDAVAAPFAPDEREESSRERWINRIVRKYAL